MRRLASSRTAPAAAWPSGEVSDAGSSSLSSPLAKCRARTKARPSRRAAINFSRVARCMSDDGLDQNFDFPAAEQARRQQSVADAEAGGAVLSVTQNGLC